MWKNPRLPLRLLGPLPFSPFFSCSQIYPSLHDNAFGFFVCFSIMLSCFQRIHLTYTDTAFWKVCFRCQVHKASFLYWNRVSQQPILLWFFGGVFHGSQYRICSDGFLRAFLQRPRSDISRLYQFLYFVLIIIQRGQEQAKQKYSHLLSCLCISSLFSFLPPYIFSAVSPSSLNQPFLSPLYIRLYK